MEDGGDAFVAAEGGGVVWPALDKHVSKRVHRYAGDVRLAIERGKRRRRSGEVAVLRPARKNQVFFMQLSSLSFLDAMLSNNDEGGQLVDFSERFFHGISCHKLTKMWLFESQLHFRVVVARLLLMPE